MRRFYRSSRRGVRCSAILIFSAICLVASAQEQDSLEQIRLRTLQELNAAQKSESAVTNAVLHSSFPAELRAASEAALSTALQLKDGRQDVSPNAVAVYLHRSDRPLREVCLLLNEMLVREDFSDRVELLRVARPFGFDDEALTAVVRREVKEGRNINRIYAAAALTRLAPRDDAGHSVLREFLASDDAGTLWRAAEAWGESTGDDPQSLRRIETLMRHDDVRVRISAGYNRWRKQKEPAATIPILIDALAVDDEAMPMAYISPSRTGQSHRIYAARALSALRRDGSDVLEALVRLVETFAKADPESAFWVETALIALAEVVSSGPTPPATADRLKRLAGESPIFRKYPEMTENILRELRVSAGE